MFRVDASNEHGQFIVWVIDNSGLVSSARRWHDAALGFGGEHVIAAANPDSSEVAAAWLGGVCYHGPTLTVDGSSDGLDMTVRPHEGEGPPDGFCNFLGVTYGVVLSLSAPVAQDNVSVDLVQ
ncbi:MAG: hypothetical protein QOJ81_1605 [Chloroflexota bacterium]|nr:hypothetical protein [Chloroflexota bacterium]